MSVKIMPGAPSEEQFKSVIHDLTVMNVYLGMAISEDPDNKSMIELFDHHQIANTGNQFVRDLEDGSWLIFFQVGGGSGSSLLGVAAVETIEGLPEVFEKMLKLPTTTIQTTRNYFSEADINEPIGVQHTNIEIASSFVKIYLMPADNFKGSWTKELGYVKLPVARHDHFMDLFKDPRDKTL